MEPNNPFRNFSKETVEACVGQLQVDITTLNGRAREHHSSPRLKFSTTQLQKDALHYFAEAMNTELEHGIAGPSTNITDDDALKTAQIVVAHLNGVEFGRLTAPLPFPTYYDCLWWMEKLHEETCKKNLTYHQYYSP